MVLHLLPGLLAGALYFMIVPVVRDMGFPGIMALIIAGILVLLPFEAAILLLHARSTGTGLFRGVIQNIQPLKSSQYFIWVPVILVLTALLFKLFSFSSDFLVTLFDWLPASVILDMGPGGEYSKQALIITYALMLVFMVLVVPAMEELYFRGYLLPRMPLSLRGTAPVVHSALFALYHTWTPWMFVTRTVGLLPLVYTVQKKRNIYIAVIVHCLLNSVDFFAGVIFILSLS